MSYGMVWNLQWFCFHIQEDWLLKSVQDTLGRGGRHTMDISKMPCTASSMTESLNAGSWGSIRDWSYAAISQGTPGVAESGRG